MSVPQFFVYRSTTDKLNDAFARITDEGDEVVPPLYHLGSRDWLVLVRKADVGVAEAGFAAQRSRAGR